MSTNMDVIALLAAGLVQASERGLVQAGLYPYPIPLHQAANRLCATLALSGRAFPVDLPELLTLCRTPLKDWPLFAEEGHIGGSLLEDGRPTSLCLDLAIIAPNSDWEITGRRMKHLQDEFRQARRPDLYQQVRHFLIAHPILDGAAERALHQLRNWREVKPHLLQFYEEVPSHLEASGEIWACPYCGWTLEQNRHGEWHCGDHTCALRQGRLDQDTKRIPWSDALQRLRPPFRRFVLLPGLAELLLHAWLLKQQVEALELWPDFDRVDLRFTLAGRVWEVDVKDWADPYRLARALAERQTNPGMPQPFYVYPDELLTEYSGYDDVLATYQTRAYSMKSFKRKVRQARRRES